MDFVFDLDGTLIDSKSGIVDSLRRALNERGLRWVEPLDWCVGPPAEVCMQHLLPMEPLPLRDEVVTAYRQHYALHGWKETRVFPGVREMLDRLLTCSHRLFICTAKKREFVELTLRQHDLGRVFTAIAADPIAAPVRSKAQMLQELQIEQHIIGVMVGDRSFDIEAGQAASLKTIAVLYGYGTREELVPCSPDYLCETVAELTLLLTAIDTTAPFHT